MKRILVLVAAVGLFVAPLHADVEYTLHLKVKAVGRDAGPMPFIIGQVLSHLFPAGAGDQDVIASDQGTRTENEAAVGNLPSGIVTIVRSDGQTFVLNPAAQTYWTRPSPVAEAKALHQAGVGMSPDATATHLPDSEVIEGLKTEHWRITRTLPMPPGPRPPGMPANLTITMDLWKTDAVKLPTSVPNVAVEFAERIGLGNLKSVVKSGFMLRGIINELGNELIFSTENIRTDVKEPASAFKVPAGYMEVPAPRPGLPRPR